MHVFLCYSLEISHYNTFFKYYSIQVLKTYNFQTGNLFFTDAPDFCPNLTPKQMIQMGSFGATYFRPINSSVTGLRYDRMWEELPQNWLEGKHHRFEVY